MFAKNYYRQKYFVEIVLGERHVPFNTKLDYVWVRPAVCHGIWSCGVYKSD